MIDDIKPPERLANVPHDRSDRLMNSVRLRGHMPYQARQRLAPNNAAGANAEAPEPIIDSTTNTENTDAKELAAEIEQKIEQQQIAEKDQSNRLKLWWHNHKKLIVASLVLLLILIASLAWFLLHRSSQSEPQPLATTQTNKTTAPVKPVIVTSPLTGAVLEQADLAKRPVTGIMIENSPDARPQSGLRDAGVIFEAIAEGGITRFLALYQEGQPNYIGPVRSIRPYYLDFLTPFDASIAHVGGSKDALQEVRSGMKDLDQFFNASYYSRITQRFAPHNVYTGFSKLDSLNQKKGYTSSSFTGFGRKKDNALAIPTAKTIDLAISGYLYNAHYDYDALSNSYLRSEAGKAQIDVTSASDKTGQQLKPKVVIAVVMPYSYGAANDGYRSTYSTTGSGTAYVFQDGAVSQGTWNKADKNSQFVFRDSSGVEIKLNAGQTWITVMSANNQISYKP